MAATLALEDAADADGTASPTGPLVDRLLMKNLPRSPQNGVLFYM
jgi:hypothetical protein